MEFITVGLKCIALYAIAVWDPYKKKDTEYSDISDKTGKVP